ncbi:hypothetical protein WICMUC_005629 [Wickerhamomyces mucosus]|uniref:Condensation domain-containing protein n=1 Tax=Wickerhamomyces mucosus TaxID=1378264 RepID=A0A9P8T5Z0_9ASCO|nr:hypothetical protein WICMUC_005629 [Wickerhamomyces mucosus]
MVKTTYTQSQLVRKLGKFEKFFASLITLDRYNSFHTCIKLDNIPTPEQIDQSVLKLLQNLKFLNYSIFEDRLIESSFNTKDIFKSLDYAKSLKEFSSEVIDKVKFEHNSKTPLVQIIQWDQYFFFILDHTLYDGRCAIELSKQFVEVLNSKEGDIFDDIFPLEELLPEIKKTQNESVEEQENLSTLWRLNHTLEEDPKHYFRIIKLPNSALRLKQEIKSLKSSVSIALASLFFLSQIKSYPNIFHQSSNSFGLAMGIDTRSSLSQPAKFGSNSIGYYGEFRFPQNEEEWDVIRKYSTGFIRKVKSKQVLNPFYDFVTEVESLEVWNKLNRDTDKEKGLGRSDLQFTFIREADYYLLDHERYRVVDAYFGQSSHNLTFAFALNLTVYEDDLNFVFTMVKNQQITERMFDKIIDKFLKSLPLTDRSDS